MERLWAPWRLRYVAGAGDAPPPGPTGCIFCDKPAEAGGDADVRNHLISRGASCFTLLNAFPYTNGHLMVVPYRHVSHPAELTDAENAELMATAARWTALLDRAYRPDGYNLGMNVGTAGGAGIAAHLHLHVVPRWNGDTNFMPVVGGVKVMPETLDQTYAKLSALLAESGAATDSGARDTTGNAGEPGEHG